MVEDKGRGASSALPPLGLQISPGGQAGFPNTACISNIKLHSRKREYLFEGPSNYSGIEDRFSGEDYKRLFSYIKSKKKLKTEYKEEIHIYPNMVEIKPTNKIQVPRRLRNFGRKGIVTEFSVRSRRNFIKYLCRVSGNFRLWQDFTFADDVMKERGIRERRDVLNQSMNRFRRIVKRTYPEMGIVYKKEWVRRKSGILEGLLVPHVHGFITFGKMKDDEVSELALNLAETWVNSTGTEEVEKALSVAQNAESYRIVVDQDMAIRYASKYVTKPGELKTEESIGRSWGVIGKVKVEKPEIKEMTPGEMKAFKKLLREVVPENHYLREQLEKEEQATFVIVTKERVDGYLESINEQFEEECSSFFEFMNQGKTREE
ncbi:MAG: hypothetical protein ABR911_03425 [Syntrophales bacterium]